MAVVASANTSSVKIKFDHGRDVNGENIVKTKTYAHIKSATSNEDIMAVVNVLVGLQKHTLSATNRIDNTSLSE